MMIRTLVLVALASVGCADEPRVAIEREGDVIIDVEVSLAITADERQRGLRDYDDLPTGRGMLIVMPQVTEACIHNADVDFAIDVLVIGADDSVIDRALDIPARDSEFRCYDGVAYILEVNAMAASMVQIGDRARLSL